MPDPSALRDPYPHTWELPTATGLGLVVGCVVATHLGRSVACLVATGHWWWPKEFLRSAAAVLSGSAGAGLPPHACPVGRAWLLGAVAVSQVAFLVAAAAIIRLLWLRWGPGTVGYAGPDEVRRLLGRQRLRSNRAIIRPDLFRKRTS